MYANAKSNKKKSPGLTLTWHLNSQLQYAKTSTPFCLFQGLWNRFSCKKWPEISWKWAQTTVGQRRQRILRVCVWICVCRSNQPAIQRTTYSSNQRTIDPSNQRSIEPTIHRTNDPSNQRSIEPANQRSIEPTIHRTFQPTIQRTIQPTNLRSTEPTIHRTSEPSNQRSIELSTHPSNQRSIDPITQ